MDFSRETLFNVIEAETGGTWDCSLVGKDGELGCLQIRPKIHNIDPLDFEASVRYFISEYKAGREWQWTSCSCTKSARLTVKNLPKGNAIDFRPNTVMSEGTIAILEYGGIRHLVAYTVTPTGLVARLEGNFKPCRLKDRLIRWDEMNEHILGFYAPPTSLVINH